MSDEAQHPPPPPRPVVDLSGNEIGAARFGDLAGRDIRHEGIDAAGLRAILHQQTEFYTALVTAYERQYKDVTGQLDLIRREFDIYQKGEKAQRQARQELADKREREHAGREQLFLWWLAALTLALLLAAGVVGWLVWRETLVLGARAVYDAAVPILSLRRR